ncbi:MAG: hypothetical protein IT443_04940 [Phycisphaeraceae bacterium]|nr:hypothetical protein [Phycisphaeraceae bacterium]
MIDHSVMLSDPPFLSHYLFEQPIPLALFFLLMAVVFVLAGMRRGSRRVLILAGSLGVDALTVVVLAWAITTPREAVIASSRQLVQSTSPLSLPAVEEGLGPNMLLVGPDGHVWLTRAQVLDILRTFVQRHGIDGQRFRLLAAEARAEVSGTVVFDLVTSIKDLPPLKTRWLIQWQREANESSAPWRVQKIQWLDQPDIGGIKPVQGLWNN